MVTSLFFMLNKIEAPKENKEISEEPQTCGGNRRHYIFEPSENLLGESFEKRKNAGFSPAVNIPIVCLR